MLKNLPLGHSSNYTFTRVSARFAIGIRHALLQGGEGTVDDAKIATEMSMDEIARQLGAIRSDVKSLKADMTDMKADMTTMKTDMAGMKTDVTGLHTAVTGLTAELKDVKAEMKSGFNDSKVRDEELRSLMKFGLEAREALRESVDARFDAADSKYDEQIGLLKDVLRAVRSSP